MRRLPTQRRNKQELTKVLGKRIQGFRRERKWIRPHLASILEIKAEWLESYELGKSTPPTYTVYQLAKVLGVSAGALLDDEPEEQPVSTSTRLVQLVRRLERLPRPGLDAVLGFLEPLIAFAERFEGTGGR
jgi:transcriptional regulator with XRE-family HTH domain